LSGEARLRGARLNGARLEDADFRRAGGAIWLRCEDRFFFALAALTFTLLGASGCSHRRQASQPTPQALPPPQRVYVPPTNESGQPEPTAPAMRIPPTPAPPGGVTEEDLNYIATHRPILTEEGLATWYTAPYKGRRSANGQVFDDDAMTAAHRTLPMGTLILATNLETGQSAAMRITDRGPFVDGRILDMTIASAKATGVYRVGLARVRIDVFETPKSINTGGRWCVQIGAFHSEHAALRLKEELLRTYADANVIEFPGENSYWVRIRPEGDDRETAEYIARHLRPSEGEAYLTRLD
jgi:rare lipoprotein A